ncbi:hypothetical protein pb186bvf_004720 [Paramecium bursaria]
MQGILMQQQDFTQKLLRTMSREFQPSESLQLELKHQLESYFIELKQVEYQLKESSAKHCHSCMIYKQQLVEECERMIQDGIKQEKQLKLDQMNTDLLILQNCNEQLELQKVDLLAKLNDSRQKFEELIRQRKEDKDNYRQQYESLKKKAQDKIHRLKDKNLVFQTQLQTMVIEHEHLKLIQNQGQTKLNKQKIHSRLKIILNELHNLRTMVNGFLLDQTKFILNSKDQLNTINKREPSVSRHQTGTIIRRNNTPPEPSKIKLYFSHSQSIQSSPDRKLKTEKPHKRINATRSSISKNLLAEFDASAQLTKYIKYYNAEQQFRNSTGFHPKLL